MKMPMPSAVYERDAEAAEVTCEPGRRRRPGQALVLAWSEAVLRKAFRIYNDRTVGTRRGVRLARVDPYSTSPMRLSASESERLAEIISQHPSGA
jgi:hypothetical protein